MLRGSRMAGIDVESSASTPPLIGPLELYGTVAISGASVMTIEIIGTRVIGPVFGVGLYVWSALLTVTMAALAIGYYAGGVLADRKQRPQLLGIVVVAAGVALSISPLLRGGVLAWGEGFGLRLGPLVVASLLFAPALAALGMVGPIAARLATRSALRAGRSVGTVYAISTAGSLLGTLVAGFIAIPLYDATTILAGIAGALVVTGGAALALRGRVSALGLLLIPFAIGGGSAPPLPSGIRVLAQSQSLLGLVEVISDENRGVRFMRSDHSLLGASFERDGSPAFGFVEVLSAIHLFKPDAKTALNIGLGTGAVPTALRRRGVRVDVVEIDPAVVRFAKSHFAFSTTGQIYEEDARAFLRHTREHYQLVIHDTFTGGATPDHLLSLEVLERIRTVLTSDGVLALNFVGFYEEPNAAASFAVARTLRAVFPFVNAYRDSPPDAENPVGNILFFASMKPLTLTITPATRFDSATAENIQRHFSSWPALENVPDGPLITDAHNPLGRHQLPVAESHFLAMNKLLPTEVWLN